MTAIGPKRSFKATCSIADKTAFIYVCPSREHRTCRSNEGRIKTENPGAKSTVGERARQSRGDEGRDSGADNSLHNAHVSQGAINKGASQKWR